MSSQPSPFFEARFSRRFPIPMLAFEAILNKIGDADLNNDQILKVYSEVLGTVCHITKPTEADLVYLSDRIKNLVGDEVPTSEATFTPSSKRGFSTEFTKMLGSQPPYSLVIQMVGFNYKEAERVYCEVDREDALAMIDVYILRLQQDHQLMLEATVFGSGSNFDGDKGDTTEVDLTGGSESSVEAAKNFF